MTQNSKKEKPEYSSTPGTRSQSPLRCLFVGDMMSLRRVSLRMPLAMPVDICQIYDVAERLQQDEAPNLVLSFAITPMFDCLELAQMLVVNGYRGRQRIVDMDLPAPRVICREVRQACPALDFGILQINELAQA